MTPKAMIFGIIAALAICGSGPAMAMPKDFTIRWYYTDASKTAEAGEFMQTCSGRIYQSGTATPYYDEVTGDCSRTPPVCDFEPTLDDFLACVLI